MGNKLPDTVHIGTIGEIFVQLRLLELGVQAAPPIKDSGNDLIAIRGEIVKYIQVKTSVGRNPGKGKLPRIYHLVCLVNLVPNEQGFSFDQSKIFVLDKEGNKLGKLNSDLISQIWS